MYEHEKRARARNSAARLVPGRKGHRAAGPGHGTVARHIIDELHFQVFHRAGRSDPVPDFRRPEEELLHRKRKELLLVLMQQPVDRGAVNLLVDNDMAQSAGGDYRHSLVAAPILDGLPERLPELVAAARRGLVRRIKGIHHERNDGIAAMGHDLAVHGCKGVAEADLGS